MIDFSFWLILNGLLVMAASVYVANQRGKLAVAVKWVLWLAASAIILKAVLILH